MYADASISHFNRSQRLKWFERIDKGFASKVIN
jgi:hypothetical protein